MGLHGNSLLKNGNFYHGCGLKNAGILQITLELHLKLKKYIIYKYF